MQKKKKAFYLYDGDDLRQTACFSKKINMESIFIRVLKKLSCERSGLLIILITFISIPTKYKTANLMQSLKRPPGGPWEPET